MKAILVLEDGSVFEGVSIGVEGEKIGEVVLNTAVVGYQEMLTDPANAGKILVLTYPLIGNYGVAEKFNESAKCWVAGLVIKEESRIYSNWQAQGPFGDFLAKNNVFAISDVDTRTLAVNIRDKGEMLGIISTKDASKESLMKKLKASKSSAAQSCIKDISIKKPTEACRHHSGPKIAVLDLGMCASFTKQLASLGSSVTLLPYDTTADEILSMKFSGLVISGGSEADAGLPRIADTVKALLGKIPIMGISTGHEVIALALGARLTRMKIGHHGVNYPVIGEGSLKGRITVQNHSYVVDDASIKSKKGVVVTLRNVNDKTIEEMESKALKFISVQYYPASPGFGEPNEAFLRFLKMIPAAKARAAGNARSASSGEVCHAKA